MANQSLTQYDEFADRHEAAYVNFRRVYELKNPPPQKIKASAQNRFMVAMLVVLAMASVIVSGSRTINEFGGGFIGVSAFVMLEMGIMAYAYIRTRIGYNEERHEDVKRLINRGMWLAFAVAVGANLHATLKSQGLDWQLLNVVIFVLVAISAPVLAFITGDAAGMLSAMDHFRQRRVDNEHTQLMSVWLSALNTEWTKEQSRWGAKIQVAKPQTMALSAPDMSVLSVRSDTDNGQTRQSSYGHNRTSDGQQKVIEYLNTHPDAAALPSRKLATLIGVGHDTANKGRNAWQKQRQTGHGLDQIADDSDDTEPSQIVEV